MGFSRILQANIVLDGRYWDFKLPVCIGVQQQTESGDRVVLEQAKYMYLQKERFQQKTDCAS